MKEEMGREQIKRMIKGKMDYSFVTAYSLLRDQKRVTIPQQIKDQNGHITSPVCSKVSRLRGRLTEGSSFGQWFQSSAR